jgi:hypothetical protein
MGGSEVSKIARPTGARCLREKTGWLPVFKLEASGLKLAALVDIELLLMQRWVALHDYGALRKFFHLG